MEPRHQQHFNDIQDLVLTHLTPVLTNKLEAQKQFILQVKQTLSNHLTNAPAEETRVERLEMLRDIKIRKELLAKMVNEMILIPEEVALNQEFEQYFTALQTYAESLPESLLDEQSLARFQQIPNDKLKIKVGKTIKNWGLHLGWIPYKIINWVRVKGNKAPKPLKMWKHEIPLRNMVIYHFRDLVVEQLVEIVQTINRVIAASTYELYKIEAAESRNFAMLLGENGDQQKIAPPDVQKDILEKILSRIEELSHSIPGITASRLERIDWVFQINYELVGTIELPVKTFNESGLSNIHQRASSYYQNTMSGWRNTLSVLVDQYNFDHELFHARFTNYEQYLFFNQKLESRICHKILGNIDQLFTFLETRQQKLTIASNEDEGFKKALNEIRFETSRFLKGAIPECIQNIREQNIPMLVENLETKTRNEIAQLSEYRSVVKNISYEHAIKDSEINKIAPKDLITFEALPQYLKTIQKVQTDISTVIESTQQQLMEISNICDFNLETALAAIEDASQHDKAKSMSIEGIERAQSRLQDIAEDLKEIVPKAEKTLRQGLEDFNKHIMALDEINEVYDTQVRIAKARAVERAKAMRQEYVARFREFIPRMITNTKRQGLMLYKRYRDTTQRYGIGSSMQSLTAEIAGFLADTDKTVRNLPFVYQRLFEISPLDNVYFYEPRPRINLDLKKAYENWLEGHYGGTALIADAGSGATTLIRFFLDELKSPFPVIWLETKKQIYESKDLYKFFSKTLDADGIDSTELLVNYLNDLDGKRILVLEDLEHFFLRKVNGFDCIRIFIELLTRTNKNIFWLMTVDRHTYQYLTATTGIDDCFSYNIDLRPLKPEQVTSLVLKRHRASGFSVKYKAHKIDRKNVKFKKMSEEERQAYLQNEYVSILNQFVNGNASLALIYWIRSIAEVKGDVMYIRSLKGLDTSFLTKLSEEKLFTLDAMLLHDGITIDGHAKVFKQTVEKSKLTILPLFDDGLVVQKDERYYINPLLFMQVVNLLKDRNILH